jgi:hypothetical protein
VESAVVVYLRTMIDRIEPYQPDPLPVSVGFGHIELVREAATMVMLLAAGWLAGRNRRVRWAYAVLAFGVWDIAYYVFLKVMDGWPHSLLDWDVLFLLPLPWWGPVLAPAAIAVLLAAGATLVIVYARPERPLWPGASARRLGPLGCGLALYAFMADTLRAASGGGEAVRTVLPAEFNWPVFVIGFVLLAAPVVDVARQIWARGHSTNIHRPSFATRRLLRKACPERSRRMRSQ